MRPDDSEAALDRDDFGGDEPELYGADSSGVEPVERAGDVEVETDEELLEADLGERDELVADDPELDEFDDDFDPRDDEPDDEAEMTLLQDLGIDLDAADESALDGELERVLEDDDPVDDEVAA